MAFMKTVELWRPEVEKAVRSGELKLTRGQWVQCNKGDRKSRFVELVGSTSTIRCAHGHDNKALTERFIEMVVAVKQTAEMAARLSVSNIGASVF